MQKTGDDYFDSKEFRELLSKYEESVSSGQPFFMDADELTDIADYYHFTGDLDLADDAIERALSLNPGATLPLAYKIRESLAQEDIEQAEELLSQIVDKSDPEYLYMQAEVLIAQNKIEEADNILREHFQSIPSDDYQDYVFDVAKIYLDYGVNEKAYEWMMRSSGNDSPDFKELMGHVMFGLGKFKDSQRIFNELLDKNPYSTHYWNALASAQFMNEDYGDSITSSEYAIAIDPTDTDGLINKANGLFRLNNYEEAFDYYQRYHALMPDNDFCELQLGVCLLNMNRTEESIGHLQKAAKLTYEGSPNQIQIYQELAFAFSAANKLDDALACIDSTQALDCDHADMEVLRGHILLENQKTEQAEAAFRTAISDSGNSPQILLRIIVSLYDNKYLKAAYTMFLKFFQTVGDEYNEGYSYMALCCWDLKRYRDFLFYLKEALRRNPKEAHAVLGHLFPNDMETTDYYTFMKKELNI